MAIFFDESSRIFKIDTANTSYVAGLVYDKNLFAHMYYGARIEDADVAYLTRINKMPERFLKREDLTTLGSLPTEYPGHGAGDLRDSAICVETEDGMRAVNLTYKSHRVVGEKAPIEGQPATFTKNGDAETLIVTVADPYCGVEADLYYSVFGDSDALVRSAEIRNVGDGKVYLTRALSACLDMENREFDVISLHGDWASERQIRRRPLDCGQTRVGSFRGVSSHQANPFMALCEHTATFDTGSVYAMNLIYSGNFMAEAEMSEKGQIRFLMGIHPEDFTWTLEAGESFHTPEAVLVYSACGLNGMSHVFHDLYRNHLIRSKYVFERRPAVINNWEGTYFNFDSEKLLAIAKDAAETGIEMFVLDDGWFGKRDDDNSGLGDWFVNEKKLVGGLQSLVEKINAMGLKFGLWFEPEMVSPDSDLYRAHPDYALQIPGRPAALSRAQLVLDISRKEVRDNVYGQMKKVLESTNIEYVKWDMNRNLSDVASYALNGRGQGELFHRYVLGLYDLQNRLVTDFPDLLLENCSSGGGRFDPAMLFYSPQIWTSDNADAIDRLRIQEGTALCYPLSSMGAHVSVCPNHTNGRVTPFETRANVALCGGFGYELDLTKLSAEEKAMIPGQMENYKRYSHVFRNGDYYRLASFTQNRKYDAYMSVTKDQKEAVLVYVNVTAAAFRSLTPMLYPRGLDAERNYRCSVDGSVRKGGTWMNAGVVAPMLRGDFASALIVFEAQD